LSNDGRVIDSLAEKKNLIDKVAKTPEESIYHSEVATDESSLIHSPGVQEESFMIDEEEPAFTTRVMKSSRRHGRRSVRKQDN